MLFFLLFLLEHVGVASLHKDSKSPYWYLRLKDPETGKWRSLATRYRHGIAKETQKAREKCAEASFNESKMGRREEPWAAWVPEFLTFRYGASPLSHRRGKLAWKSIQPFLLGRGILSPQQLTRTDCLDYFKERTKSVAHNTALIELTFLGVICDEARKRGIISVNPAYRLGIGKVRGKEKPELTDENIKTIRAALKMEPAWMSHAFEIALHQGCRLGETAVLTDDVDLKNSRLHFRRTKGDKPFTVPLNPGIADRLKELVAKARSSGSEKLFELPYDASRQFHYFFKAIKLPHLTFHSTRVSVASRLARSGYPIAKAMRLLNHGSELVHRSYQRLQAEDVADAYDVLSFDGKPSSGSPG